MEGYNALDRGPLRTDLGVFRRFRREPLPSLFGDISPKPVEHFDQRLPDAAGLGALRAFR